MYDTLDEWVVISPKEGARIIFKRDKGRYEKFPFVCLDDATTQAFLVTGRDELQEGETISQNVPLPQPYREDYHRYLQMRGPIPCENQATLLPSSAVERGDNDVKKGKILKTVRRIFEGGRNGRSKRLH